MEDGVDDDVEGAAAVAWRCQKPVCPTASATDNLKLILIKMIGADKERNGRHVEEGQGARRVTAWKPAQALAQTNRHRQRAASCSNGVNGCEHNVEE